MELSRWRGMLKLGLAVKLAALAAAVVVGWSLFTTEPGPVSAQSDSAPAAQPAQPARPEADKKAEQPADPAGEQAAAAPAQPVMDPRVVRLIEQRQAELTQKEAMLARERQELDKLKEDVVARIAELKKVQAVLEKLVAEEQSQRQARIAQLVKVLSNMKAPAAAAVVARLDDQMAVEIFSRMQSRTAGQVMANLDPAQAARISVLLTRQQQADQAAKVAKEVAR